MNIRHIVTATVVGTGCLFLAACQKDKPTDDPNEADIKSAVEWTIADQLFGELKNIADQGEKGLMTTYKNGGAFADCATVTHNQASKEFTINFGPSNCLCKDGRNRRGALKVTYSTAYWDSAGTVTITPISYYVNDFRVEGTKEILNNGTNQIGQPNWSITVEGMIIYPGGLDTVYWESARKHTWVKGYNSIFIWTDDTWEVNGSGDLITSNNEKWHVVISSPLRRDISCKYVSKGVIEISAQGKASRIIDYGQGICDDDATLSMLGRMYPFKLD